jgi:diguanylate cyclase (GGDEF)-like protein/PAS domain S-box-containing protein
MNQESLSRILVIDDNSAIHDDFRKILSAERSTGAIEDLESELFGMAPAAPAAKRESYHIDSAYQGQDGHSLVKRSIETGDRYPVAFVDMRMPPGWDGLETIEKLWEVDPDLQVVICTAYSDYSWEDIVAKFGSRDRLLILKKPFDTAEVSQLACALTEKWRLARHAHLKLNQLRAMVDEQTRELEEANRRLMTEVEQRKLSEDRYSLAARGANDGLWDWDLESGTVYYSPRWKAMLGYGEDEVGDSPDDWKRLIHPDDLSRFVADLEEHFAGLRDQLHVELRMRHHDGTDRWMLCRGIAVHEGEGPAVRAAGSLTDITDRKVAEEQLRFEALHDALTGLANRALLSDRLQHALHRAKRDPSYRFAVMIIDLDCFKVINDSLGHLIGDRLLMEIGRRLVACARRVDTIARIPRDHVARFGGDEFVMLLEGLRDPIDSVRVAERVHAALAEPFRTDGRTLNTFASIGIATGNPGYERAEEVLRDADAALYQAKGAGKACTRMFDPEMHARAMARWSIEADLRQAIERKELVLHYQPIVDVEGEIVAMEALVRWTHPTRGFLPPDVFIPIAEETGLIVPLGRWVMREACEQLHAWRTASPALGVSVNVSNRQFSSPGFIEDVVAIIAESGVDPSALRVEITETTAMRDTRSTIASLERLRDLGVSIYMDDFGTGYSSLGQLHRMPIDALKIDRDFVAAMDRDHVSESIVEAITALAHAMNLRVIAEGVETEEQAERLRRIGCDHLQGYHFGRPMPAEAVAERLMPRKKAG